LSIHVVNFFDDTFFKAQQNPHHHFVGSALIGSHEPIRENPEWKMFRVLRKKIRNEAAMGCSQY